MISKIKQYPMTATLSIVLGSSGGFVGSQFMPQFQETGYVSMNLKTGEIKPATGNATVEFATQYFGDEMIEKDKVYSLIEPVGAKAQIVEVNVDGQQYACAPKGTQPAPTPAPAPTPVPPPTGKVSWGITYTKVPEAQAIAAGDGIKVCVVDTGVANHPALQGKVIERYSAVGDDGVDRFGHGTHVIGTIAGPNGIGASHASIISIKVLTDNGSGSMQAILQGFQGCAQRGAKIISASLGSDQPSSMFQQMIQWLSNQGIYVVMAGGNNGSGRFSYPAAYARGVRNAFAVIATLPTGGRAPFSQYELGFPADNFIAAPGANIYSTLPPGGCALCNGNTSGFGEMSGTSMATPLVAGIVADLLSAGKVKPLGNTSNDSNVGIIIDALKSVRGQ